MRDTRDKRKGVVVETGSERLTMPVNDKDHVRGSRDADITLVEYADFECPYCRGASLCVDKVREKLGERLRFVYRHFPLENVHPHAFRAAEASEAAAAQDTEDGFWAMYERLFENQRRLTDEDLVSHARTIGLDSGQFVQDMNSHVHEAKVREDLESGLASGVTGTPAFFINDSRYHGSYHPNELLVALEEAEVSAGKGK